jgi:hypothetical protein
MLQWAKSAQSSLWNVRLARSNKDWHRLLELCAVQSRPLDDAIAQRLLTAVTPKTIELALEARKRMLRLLINNITVVDGPEPRLLQLHIRWQGGETETIKVYSRRADAVRYPDVFVAKIRALAELDDDHEIVAPLNGEGEKTRPGRPSRLAWYVLSGTSIVSPARRSLSER